MYWSVLKASHLTVLCTSLPPSPLPHFNLPSPSILPPPSLASLPPNPVFCSRQFSTAICNEDCLASPFKFWGVLSRRLWNVLARNLVFKKVSCGSVRIVTREGRQKNARRLQEPTCKIFNRVLTHLHSFSTFCCPSLLFSTSAHCFKRLREHIFKNYSIFSHFYLLALTAVHTRVITFSYSY